LLDTRQVDPDAKSKSRLTPIWLAAENRREAVVRLLLSINKVDLNVKDKCK
jgi:ankyrin repeat protein